MAHRVIICVLCFCIVTTGTLAVTADSEFQLSVADSIDVPDRTYTLNGTELTVSEVATVALGQGFTVNATAPTPDTEYTLYLINQNKNIVDTVSLTGSAAAKFSTSLLSPGTYLLVVKGPDRSYRAILPVVIANHEINVSVPNTVKPSGTLSISATVSRVAMSYESAQRIEAIIIHEQTTTRITLNKTAEGPYKGSLNLSGSGDYRVYVVARGSQTLLGENETEFLGVSGIQQVTARNQTPTATHSPTEPRSPVKTPTQTVATPGSGSDAGEETTATETQPPVTQSPTATDFPNTASPTATAASSVTESPQRTTSTTTEPSPSPTQSASPSVTSTSQPTAPPTTENVITPNATVATTTEQRTTASAPSGLPVILLSVLGLALVVAAKRA